MKPSTRAFALLAVAAAPLAARLATADAAAADPPPATPQQDSVAALRDRAAARVLERIAGREDEPAEEVFENVRALRGIPAGRLVRIMNQGFGASLGVACGHCHVRGDWSSDDKPQKQIARDMWAMTRAINQELSRIPNLDSDEPTVNCTTCHRGQVKPATRLAAPPPAADGG